MGQTRDKVKLFSKVELLDTQRHQNLRWACLKGECQVSCCKIPDRTFIVLDEIVKLSKYFPVGFTVEVDRKGREERLVCAYLRLKDSQRGCVYLKEDVGCLIEREKPYTCRQYPFFIQNDAIAIDLTCLGFSYTQGEKVLEGDGINPYFEENFLTYSLKIENQRKLTSEFVNTLFELDLIVGAKYVEDALEVSFNMVDEDRLLSLPLSTLKDFSRLGYMRYIYAHLNSLENWSKLFSKRNLKGTQGLRPFRSIAYRNGQTNLWTQ